MRGVSWILIPLAVLMLGLVLPSCGNSDSDDDDDDTGPVMDGDDSTDDDDDATDGDDTDGDTPTVRAYTTLVQRLEPTLSEHGEECEGSDEENECSNPAEAMPDMSAFEAVGFGEWNVTEGEVFGQDPAPGVSDSDTQSYGERRSLFAWAHLSDVHITDEESPNRMGMMDSKGIPSALRPMDMFSEHVLNAAVRAINYFHSRNPIDLVLVSGDSTDNAQWNEMANFMAIMNGGEVDPDSGADDDPIPGPGNDPQDPFVADGLNGIPWIVGLGNHDELILGNWEVTDKSIAEAIGADSSSGTRDGTTYQIVRGEIPADENRRALRHAEMIQLLAEDGSGHGFTTDSITENKGYYVYDPSPDSIVRFIVLDSAYRPSGYNPDLYTYVSAVIDREQYEDFLIPELDRAKQEHKLVIISMHHGSGKLQDDGYPDDYITTAQLTGTLSSYDNVLIHCIGHSHENTLTLHENEDSTGGYFEIQASSLIDWPQQFRMYELVDNGNGTLSVFTVVMNHAAEPDSFAEISRRYSLMDVQAGWGEGGAGISEQRNVEMIFKVPDGFTDAVAAATGKTAIQALTSWAE